MKLTIKKTILSLATVAMMATQSHAIFGVGDVVYDPAAVYQAIKQVTEMKKQYDEMIKQTAAVTGVRNAVQMYADIKDLTGTLKQYKVTFDDLDIRNPKSQLGLMAQKIFEENQIFDRCGVKSFSALKQEVCENKQIRNITNIATAISYSEELEKTAKRLETLGNNLANSEDVQTTQTISAAIQLEMANLEISKSHIEMMAKSNESKDKADEDRLKQEKAKCVGKSVDTSNWY